MSIIISYNKYQDNWYVGELHHAFALYMKNLYGDIEIRSLADMANQYNEPIDTRHNSLASIFNIYNLIVYNTNTNVGFLHSLADYAPVLLEHQSALQKLNIKSFAFCPHHTIDIREKYQNLGISLVPSFYMLENWNDHDLISKYRNSFKNFSCYFNGLCYGHRECYVNQLQHNPFFVMKNKSKTSDYRPKELYYQELSQHKYGLSINGVAQICYRDVEYFGIGALCIREPMNIITKDSLKPDMHYKVILDDFIRNNIYYPEKHKELADHIINQINNISLEEEQYILYNARTWYENNALPQKQIEFLHQCLVEHGVL